MIAGRYALGHEIGRGGMGAVWSGTDQVLGRPVALKRLSPAPLSSRSRVEREARLAARLSHPHVVAVYDLVADGEDQWLVMEYVEGRTLAARIGDEGALSPDELAPLLGQIADGLAAAHAAGIVHRDVKPSNILLDAHGSVKLTDFGVARSEEGDATLTQTGFLTGSPAYLAPEVAAGQPASSAADVWSLGATAFHALAGHPPYEVADNVMGALYRIVHEEPPRTERAGWLAPLVAGTMTRDPAQRWSLAQVQAFLAGRAAPEPTRPLPAVAALTPPGPPPSSPRRPPLVPPPVSRPVSPPASRPASRRESALGSVLRRPTVAGGVVVLALVLALALIHPWSRSTRGGTAAGTSPSTAPTGRSTPSPARSTPSHPTAPATAAPTAAGVRAFVSTYLATASSDPARAFTMLTPQYQAASGGLAGYRSFWGNVGKVHAVSDVRPSLDPLGVSYRYTYNLRGAGKRTEEVHLRLVYRDGRYLIAGGR